MEPYPPSTASFEQLWLLRQVYSMRSTYDRRSDLTVDEAMNFAERLLQLVAVHDRWRGSGTLHKAI
jgi:hypothetical protein